MSRLLHIVIRPMFMVTRLMRMQYMHMSDTDSDIIYMTLIDLYMNNVKLIQGVLFG